MLRSPDSILEQHVGARVAKLLGIRQRAHAAGSLADLAETVRTRLTYADLERLRLELTQTRSEFSMLIDVSERTLARYAENATRCVEPAVAERALRLARVRALAEFVLEDIGAGRAWLETPQPGLGGRIPNELLRSEFGARDVETLLNRIEHGVYS